VDAGGFGHFEFVAHIPGHAEIGILIYSLRHKAHDLIGVAEDVGERRRDGGGCLDGGVGDLATIIALVDSEDAFQLWVLWSEIFYLVVSDASLEFADVHVHVPDILGVVEDEGFVQVEAAGDDILGILDTESLVLLDRELLLVEELLVVS
jgi:hypothetical protein